MFKKIALTILKNKKKSIAGGGVFGGIIISIIMLSFTATLEIQNLDKLISNETSKVVAHMEQTAAKDVMNKMVNKATNNPATATTVAEGELAQEIDKFNFNDPQITEELAKVGIEVTNDANGNFKGLIDTTTGAEITASDIAANTSGIFERLNTALPEGIVTQMQDISPLEAIQNGVTFDGLNVPNDATPAEVNKTFYDAIEQGTPATEFTPAAPTQNDTPSQTSSISQGNVVGEDIATVDKQLQNGASESTAIGAAESGVSATVGKGLLITGLLDTVCSVYKAAHHATSSRLPTIVNSLVRHFGVLNSFSSSMKLGKESPASISAFANILHQKNGNNKGYTQSAGFQIASGYPVNSQTVNVLSTSLPIINGGTKLVNAISTGGIVNFGCSVITSPIGMIVQGAVGVIQLGLDIASFSTSQVAISGALLSANMAIKHIVIPDILRYFTPLGLSGVENGPQWVNNAFLGGIITGNRVAQSLGGLPMRNSSASKIVAEANINQTKQNNSLSITARMFSTNNPYSLVSRMMFYLPNSGSSLLADIGGYFTGFFNNFFSNLSDIIMSPKIFAAGNVQAPGQPFGITTYGLSDSQITKYDPIQNEQYLYGTDTVTSGGQSFSLKRIQLTGDPFKYMGGKIDTSSTDLYHCFNQSMTSTSMSSSLAPVNFTGSSDKICGSEGSLDYNSTPPDPMQESNVLYAYCKTFEQHIQISTANCIAQLTPQYHDDIGHFTQYIIDSFTMNSYYSMMSTQ